MFPGSLVEFLNFESELPMSSVVSSQLPQHPAVERIRRFRFLYAIAVNTVAIVTVIAIVMSLRVREYRTLGYVDVTPLKDATVSLDSAAATISRAIRETAQDDSLTRIVAEIARNHSRPPAEGQSPETPPAWTAAELDGLRQRMSFAVTPDGVNGSLRLTVALSGKGRVQESELVETFLAAVSDTITIRATTTVQPVVEVLARTQLDSLKQRRAEMLVRANEQLHEVNDRIAGIADQVLTLAESSAPTGEQLAEKRPTGAIETNPFMQASFSPPPGAGKLNPAAEKITAEWRDRFTQIPVSQLSQTFAEIEKGWNETMQPLDEFVNTPPAVEARPTLRTVSRSRTVQFPFGLTSQREWLLLSVAAALAIGCVLASGIDVNSHDPGLGSPEEIEKSLGVPVLGQIRGDSGSLNNVGRHWSMRILKLNELVVFTTLLAVLVMAVTSGEIRETLFQNPLHALARILWTVRAMG